MILSSILLYFALSVCADDRVPIGVSIGETVIATAFQASSSDQPVFLNSFNGSDSFRMTMSTLMSLPMKFKQSEFRGSEHCSAIQQALRDALNAARLTLDHEVSLGAISVPAALPHGVRHGFQALGYEIDINLCDAALHALPPWRAPMNAYKLNTCPGLDLDETHCNKDGWPKHDIDPIVLFLYWQEGSLHIATADPTEGLVVMREESRSTDLGSRRVLDLDAQDFTARKEFYDDVAEAIKVILDKTFDPTKEYPVGPKHIRAIIPFGVAPDEAWEELKSVVERLMPGSRSKIRDSIHPSHVDAVGAAYQARYLWDNPEVIPKHLRPHRADTIEHNEL